MCCFWKGKYVQMFLDLGWIYSWLTHCVIQSLSPVWLFGTPQTAACQAFLSHTTINWKYLKSKMHAIHLTWNYSLVLPTLNVLRIPSWAYSWSKWPNKVSFIIQCWFFECYTKSEDSNVCVSRVLMSCL